MDDKKKEIGSIISEAEMAESTQKELSDEQLNDVAGGDMAQLLRDKKLNPPCLLDGPVA